jgi:hypothetical protein
MGHLWIKFINHKTTAKGGSYHVKINMLKQEEYVNYIPLNTIKR